MLCFCAFHRLVTIHESNVLLSKSAFQPLPSTSIPPELKTDKGKFFDSDESKAPPMPEVGKDVMDYSDSEHFKGRVEAVDENGLRIEATYAIEPCIHPASKRRNVRALCTDE